MTGRRKGDGSVVRFDRATLSFAADDQTLRIGSRRLRDPF